MPYALVLSLLSDVASWISDCCGPSVYLTQYSHTMTKHVHKQPFIRGDYKLKIHL